MKKIIKQEKDTGIIQITIADERWYSKLDKNEQPIYVPSVTWIASYYPKGVAYFKWLAQKGWDEAEALKIAAGDKGSKVHQAIVDLIDKNEVTMEAQYVNNSTGEMEELTLEEYEAIMSFVDWWKAVKPEVVAREVVVFDDRFNYAGTVDFICKINGELWIIDFKTSQYIWPSHELQVSAYKNVIDTDTITDHKIGILQLGYRRSKKKYKFTEIKDKFDLFLAAKKIWAEECSKIEPLKRDYPTLLTLKEEEANA